MKLKYVLIVVSFLILLSITTGDLTCQIEESSTCSAGTALLRMKNG